MKLTFLSNFGSYRKSEPPDGVQDAIKQEIVTAFSEFRCFPLYPDNDIVNRVKNGTSPQYLLSDLVQIKNQIFDNAALYNFTVKKNLLGNTRLSSRIMHAVLTLHQALAEIGNERLIGRRFVLIKERPGIPSLYYESDECFVLTHVGQGPRWSEVPTIYLGLYLFDILAHEKDRGLSAFYEAFKTLLEVEERAIETGYSHVEPIPPDSSRRLETLVFAIISAAQIREVRYREIPAVRKIKGLSVQQRQSILQFLDARRPEDEMAFDYDKNMKAVSLLAQLARRYKKGYDLASIYEIVRLLVAASGHDIHEVRNQANIILERLFSPKEFDVPLATRFITVRKGSSHIFTFDLPKRKTGYFIRFYEYSSKHELTHEVDLEYVDITLCFDTESGRYRAEKSFNTLGAYEYVVFKKLKNKSSWIHESGFSGRVNVIPDMRGEIILEIFPDIHGHTRVYWDDPEHPGLVYNENGEVIRLGNFSDIAAHLEDLKKRYFVTALYLLGVQKRGSNREDWAPEATSPSPFSPMDLTVIEPSLGGEEEFIDLVQKAHALGIKIIVDIVPHINRRSLALPDQFDVRCYNDAGELVVRAATDGRYSSWNDGKLLNYRKFEVWEFIARSIVTMIEKYDIDGIRFDSAHAVPIMMKKNNYPHVYGKKRTHEDMVEGTIIVNDREDDHFVTTGYYDSACRDIIASPFHYYLTLAIERKLKEMGKTFFVNIAECYWGRERVLTRSGFIPYNSALFKICENIIHGKVDVREVYHLYDTYYPSALPPGTELLGILGNHDERRAVNTFGLQGLKAATTLTSFMSNMLMDYEGSAEGEGWKVFLDNIYVNWNQFETASTRAIERFYTWLYAFHRENTGKGYLLWTNNTLVAGAMKCTKKKFIIGAFNFSETNQSVLLQFDNPRLPLEDNTHYSIEDPIYSHVTGKKSYYTGRELRVSKLQTVVSYTDRVKILNMFLVTEPGPLYRDFLRDSFLRLCSIEKIAHFPSNFAFLQFAEHAGTFDSFHGFIEEHLIPLFWNGQRHFLELGLMRTFYYLFHNRIKSGTDLLGFIDKCAKSSNEHIRELGISLKEHNRRGSLVFISAEAEPFSKIGGLANVVYELPRELVAMGEEVYVITPLYRHGERKQIDKLRSAVKRYRISYTGINVRFKIMDSEYEVGVHSGIVDGVTYYLVDHHEFFDGLYWGYTAEEKLRRRIAFSRACAEVITTFGLHPLFTFTNDAFAGIFNGIVRGDPFYSRNDNFRRTSFVHILHNVGWQYFDSYNRFERGFDHFTLFNLPSHLADEFTDPVFNTRINCMAAGIRLADRIITVSPSYAKQIEIASDGLEKILFNVKGINNAIGRDFVGRVKKRLRDSGFVKTFYPLLIKEIRKNESLQNKIESRFPEILKSPDFCTTIKQKTRRELVTRMRNKLLLQTKHNFTIDPDRVLFSMIHRIVDQKGFQLLLEASQGIFKTLKCQGIIGGPLPSGDQRGEEIAGGLIKLSNYYPESVSVSIGFVDVAEALLGSDIFLMPSLYEPGGISQLEAFACGCLVVARATGGLRDTVHPIVVRGKRIDGNGFLFADYTAGSFYDAMQRCAVFFEASDDETIQRARRKAERSVYYWDSSAREYIEDAYGIKEIIRVL